MKEIYFDNSSTTIVSPAAAQMVMKVMTEDYGNPSSMHKKGVDAEKYIREARRKIAGILRLSENEIYFTSGGTESNNWAIIGTALSHSRVGKKILTTQMEHPAVSEVLHFLEGRGYEIVRIPVDRTGGIDMEALDKELTKDTILVSMMYVNNEIGAVTPTARIGRLIRAKAPNALYHADAIQAFGKYRIFPRTEGIDLLSVSGHKIHGPKGTGFLYVSNQAHILPIIYGGGQQSGMRSGTENVPGIAGLGVAAEEAYVDFDKKIDRLYDLKEYMESSLDKLDGVILHGKRGREGAPHIVNAAFMGVGAEVLLHTLEDQGIYVSAGSACSTHKRAASPTMTAIHAPKEEAAASVRFSFSELNTKEEIDRTAGVLKEALPSLRRYSRK